MLVEDGPETAPPTSAQAAAGGQAPAEAGVGARDAGRATTARVAVVGDYGLAGPSEEAVAQLVDTFGPDAILTTGDNNYYEGDAATIDANIGQYYADYIFPYPGGYGFGAAVNRFFPALGNHDWHAPGAEPYLEYFTLPGNERYYDFSWGEADWFAVDSDANEPDGIELDSVQARWLRDRLAASSARWKIVYMHHVPYGSGMHGSNTSLRWPYREWGADVVLNGHNHVYERVEVEGVPYLTIGLGGAPIQDFVGTPVQGSLVRYNQNYGAGLIDVEPNRLALRFITVDWTVVDELILTKP